jgi:probable F420-dependent oxidoreductase
LSKHTEIGVTCGGVWWPAECFQAVEEVGFDTLWTGEHVVFHRPILDAVPLLAGVAAVTQRVKIGPAAIMVTLRHPTMLAKELATLDRISDGRLVIVAGTGGDFPKEFEACGVPMAKRGLRTSETIELLRLYWTEERFSYPGQIYQLEDVWMEPKPKQSGGPPIWLAGRSDAAIKRAARLGDGYMPYMYTAKRCRESFDEVIAAASDLDVSLREDFTWSAFVYVSMHDDAERARELGIRDLSWRYGKDFAPWIDKYCVYGTPDMCVEKLREFVDQGVDHLALGMIHEESMATETTPSLKQANLALRTIERFGTELVPALKGTAVP